MDTNRREFLLQFSSSTACLLCSGMIGTMLNACNEADNSITSPSIPLISGEPVITLASESGLNDVGGAVKKRFSAVNGGGTIIVVRVSSTSFAAFGAQCTHQGSEINLPVSGIMTCPNHGSKFNATNGNVVQGPAASPLSKLKATYDSTQNSVTIG
jgi:Rieske Fe-S protein